MSQSDSYADWVTAAAGSSYDRYERMPPTPEMANPAKLSADENPTYNENLECKATTKDRLSVNVQIREDLKEKIWEIANRLRGPYRPPQYRLVMLPMVVLRRLDCVLEPNKDAVLKQRDELEARHMPETAMDRLLGKAADPQRKHPLYNTSPYTFARLLGDAENWKIRRALIGGQRTCLKLTNCRKTSQLRAATCL